MRILIAASEAVPFAKTGGLADVTGALLKELRREGEKVSLVLPLYAVMRGRVPLAPAGRVIRLQKGDSLFEAEVFFTGDPGEPDAYFISCDELFGRPELYGTPEAEYADNARRFIFFSQALLELCEALSLSPDVIHCNDWQTAMVPLYLRTLYRDSRVLRKTASLFTIHNLGYQGIYDAASFSYTGLGMEYFTPQGVEFYGKLNIMKAGILFADLVSTVSGTYAKEIMEPEYGFGLDGVMRMRRSDTFGVLNGVDYGEWNPAEDRLLPARYGPDDLQGRRRCRKELVKVAGFSDEGAPILGIVSRLSDQKGLDLLLEGLQELVGLGVNLVIIGKGEEVYQARLTEEAASLRGRIYVRIGFDEALARLTYAGSDFFLMPSRYEPCGLGQLIAMRYGAVPVVRKTGGLADTVRDYDHLRTEGTGFLFSDYTAPAMLDAVKRAICLFTDKRRLDRIVGNAMSADFSWRESAARYLELYRMAVARVYG